MPVRPLINVAYAGEGHILRNRDVGLNSIQPIISGELINPLQAGSRPFFCFFGQNMKPCYKDQIKAVVISCLGKFSNLVHFQHNFQVIPPLVVVGFSCIELVKEDVFFENFGCLGPLF